MVARPSNPSSSMQPIARCMLQSEMRRQKGLRLRTVEEEEEEEDVRDGRRAMRFGGRRDAAGGGSSAFCAPMQ